MSSAGPAANAEARKRAAMMAVSQYSRPANPEIRNAVTVWMPMASGMAMMLSTCVHRGGGKPFFSAPSTVHPITRFTTRYEESTHISQNRIEFGVGTRITFSTRMGWPRSTTMNSTAVSTAATAMNSPMTTIFA